MCKTIYFKSYFKQARQLLLLGCCCFIFLLFRFNSIAQQYNFDHISYKNGLVNNAVRSIYQDSRGIMYFGTNSGISIYYGNAFKNISEVNGKKMGIINQIIGNEQDSIYVVASTTPFLYALHQQELTKHQAETPTYIYSMLFDAQSLLICADDGLRIMRNNQSEKINLISKDTVKYISKIISCNDQLWLIGRLGGSMELVNKKTLETTAISSRLTATQFYKDMANNIWIATKDKGILFLSAGNIANNNLQLSTIPSSLQFLSSSEINDITGDKEGNIYFATVSKGLIKMYPDRHVEIIDTKNGLSSLNVRTAFVDREGNLWIGTNMGIDKLSINKLNTYNDRFGLQSNICYDAALYKNRYLIAPNNLGFSVIDDEKKTIKNFPLAIENESYPFRTFVAGDIIYTLNKNTVAIVNKAFEGQAYTQIIPFQSRINILTKDNRQNILVGGFEGIWHIVKDKPQLIIKEADVRTILVDEQDMLWIGKYDFGLVGYQLIYKNGKLSTEKKAEWKTNYQRDHSRILIQGNDHSIWYGTRFSGLYQLQWKDGLQMRKHFDAQNGLSSDFIQSLCLLPDKRLLVGSADGLDMIDVDNHYTITTAIHHQFNFSTKINQLKVSNDGKLWMATDDGIINLAIQQLKNENAITKQVLFTSIKVKGKEVNSNSSTPLHLPHDENSISFWFSSPTYVYENNMRYAWSLVGSNDSNWTEAVDMGTASFTDVKPGNYVFKLRTLDGTNRKVVAQNQFSFVIGKPFWQRLWFIIVSILLGLCLLYWLIKQREKNIAEKEAQKTELQKLKTIGYQYQLEIEQVINYFASTINEKNSIDDLLWDVARNCIAKLAFQDCVIYLFDDEQKVLKQKAAWGPKTNNENKIIGPIEIPIGKGIVGTVALTGHAELVNDTSKDKRYIVDDEQRFSEIAVPLMDNGMVIGVIDSEHPDKNFYAERHLQILTTIASLCVDKMNKIKAEQIAREKELEVFKLQKDLATSQLTTLRTQMNPHFIFNALNSIQQYILQGNVEEANRYLSQFSKLQREVLNNSSQQFIPLEKEIELLTLYLKLEQLRFDQQFSCTIHVDEKIDVTEILIPTMIVQPFLENAIWHGLIGKIGVKTLSVDFKMCNDDILICTIRDNGIGRAASAKLKKALINGEKHQSKGLHLVHDRLRLLQQQYKQIFAAHITDILDSKEAVSGTQVLLEMGIDV